MGAEAEVVHGTLGSLGWDALNVTTLPSRASGTWRMVLSGDCDLIGPHGEWPSLLFSHRCHCRFTPMLSLSRVLQLGHSRTPSVPLAGGYSSWRSRSDALDPLPQSDFLQSWGLMVDFYFCP